FKVAVLPGDGIGPEVIAQAVRVLQQAISKAPGIQVSIESYDFGGIAIDKHGNPLPENTLKACKEAHGILMGSVGGPKWGVGSKVRPEQGLLRLRKELGVYANVRPCTFASESLVSSSPLKPEVAKGTNITIVRELIGGVYFGRRQEVEASIKADEAEAWDVMAYSIGEIKRITRVAAKIALASNPPVPLHSVDKANVLATSRLWRRVVTETVKEEFPQLELNHHFVDSAAMFIVANPQKLNGVVVTENLFGDILSDQASVIPGSLGLLPSASLAGFPTSSTPCAGLYEPIHGSAPDIAGQGIANPIGTILSGAMLLRYSLGLPEQADAVEAAVRIALDEKDKGGLHLRTRDLGGQIGTVEIGDRIVEVLGKLLQ
ncbi:Isopropylmalate dehydrogenase-like domain-containing protein, partial [Cantharellus anzutake]|uniref:Isopropylmalate dehydrogenase-like domain-containing protein n=1 Tax=Cantharellus anzutake TaxID=1750568 RepID=UPI0019034BC0